jgi:PKHD-type hydroxylase
MPTRITPPIFNKHETGMLYGPHTDNPITGRTPGVRADLAVSIFLTDPTKYEGGAVAIRTDIGEIKFRLPRGDALVYPSEAIHQIEKITSGARYATGAWLQSVVVDSNQRLILFELDRAAVMVNKKAPQSEGSRLLIKAYGNLMRVWASR